MKCKLFLWLIFIGLVTTSYGQKSSKSFLFSPTKFGIQFTQGNENSFLMDDPDYFYRTNTLKTQFFYPLTTWKSLDISLVIQPQLQFVQHQLYNEQFVRPEEANYIEKRARYTQLKNLSISALEFSFEAKKQVFKSVAFFFQIGLGFAYIDTATERLTKGFTFIENGNLGLDIQLNKKTSIQLFSGVGHVSNADLKLPNAGYNIFNTGIGFQYSLK